MGIIVDLQDPWKVGNPTIIIIRIIYISQIIYHYCCIIIIIITIIIIKCDCYEHYCHQQY